MEIKPKYNVGDIAIIRDKEEYRIGKIASISIQGNKIYYYFENIAGKYPEDVVTRYCKNTEEPKTEAKQEEAPAPTSTTELPKTYVEAIMSLNKDVKLYYRYIYQSLQRSYVGDIIHNENAYRPFSLSKETCEKIMQFEKLIFLRDIYRQGWKPDRCKTDLKYVLLCIYNDVKKGTEIGYNKVLSFQSEEIRDEFLNNFKDLIEECKEFI